MPPHPRRSARPAPPEDDFDDFEQDRAPGAQGNAAMKRLALDMLGRWYWIALFMILGGLAAFYYLDRAPKLYRSTAVLLIKQSTAGLMQREVSQDIDMRTIEAMNTIAARLGRIELLERVAAREDIRRLPGLMPEPVEWWPEWVPWRERAEGDGEETSTPGAVPPPPQLAGMIMQMMDISVVRGTRLLNLSIDHTDPKVAASLTNAIAQEYVLELTRARSDTSSSSVRLLMESSNEARAKLESAQAAFATYQKALALQKELELIEEEVRQLERRYRVKHPKMIEGLARLANMQDRFLDEFEAARRSSADREYWESVAAALDEGAQTDLNARVTQRRRLLEARASVLQSEIVSQTNVFNSILMRIQETDISQMAPDAEVEISSVARESGKPVAPVFNKVMAMGIGGGLAFGLLLAFGLVKLDNRFHTVAQIEGETGLPTLGAISTLTARDIRKASKGFSADPKIPDHPEWDPLIVFRGAASQTNFAEMFRVLRTSVSLLGDERERRITVFSSALPGEGKSSISSNFALAASRQGKKVLLIDFDLRKPAQHKMFGRKAGMSSPGITQILTGQSTLEEAVTLIEGEPTLHIVFSGGVAPNPGELLSSQRLESLLEEARARYDLVILDSAPLLPVPDTRLLAALADNFCLVVRAHYTPKGAVHRVLEVLDSAGTPPSGIVLNGFEERKRLIGQNYSYGYYRTNRYGRAYRYGHSQYGTAYGSEK